MPDTPQQSSPAGVPPQPGMQPSVDPQDLAQAKAAIEQSEGLLSKAQEQQKQQLAAQQKLQQEQLKTMQKQQHQQLEQAQANQKLAQESQQLSEQQQLEQQKKQIEQQLNQSQSDSSPGGGVQKLAGASIGGFPVTELVKAPFSPPSPAVPNPAEPIQKVSEKLHQSKAKLDKRSHQPMKPRHKIQIGLGLAALLMFPLLWWILGLGTAVFIGLAGLFLIVATVFLKI